MKIVMTKGKIVMVMMMMVTLTCAIGHQPIRLGDRHDGGDDINSDQRE